MQKKSILIIGFVWVEPNSSAAGKRMLQLINFFRAQQYAITFACAAQKSEKAIDLSIFNVDEVSIKLNSSSFDEFLKKLNPNSVLFDRFLTEEQFGWRVSENCPKAIRILDTEDLHCLRKTREIAFKKQIDFSTSFLLQQEITKREIASILRCDVSLIISTFEMQLLQKTFKIEAPILLYLPFLFDEIDVQKVQHWKSFEERVHFIFIGNFYHKPNIDAVITLKKYIWSLIREKLPNVEVHIYGAYLNQQIQQFHNAKEGFIVKGFANDASEVVQNAKVVLAPLNFGAGIKGKLTEAMRCGTPTITTKIGAEGMHGNLPWNGFITDNYSGFTEKAIELYTDKAIWKTAQNNGIDIINQLYGKKEYTEILNAKLLYLQENLEQHRQHNFIGSLLQHQSLQSTKYMSKWIESKNKAYPNFPKIKE